MECPKCHFENPAGSEFCNKCGTRITAVSGIPPSPTETIQIPIKELLPGSLFAGRYHVYEELGKGGMGRVYKVLDKEIEEKIALKLLNPEIAADSKTIERFRNELKTARQISHKNICRMYHIGKDEGSYYITMEYVRGEDLKSMIRMMGRLSAGQAIPIARQICEGLAEAHRLGVIHRDLKPQNLMIDREGTVKIMDFGIARSLAAKGITGAGMMIGTPEYMAPEQVEGNEVDGRTDIYALGVILFETLTGRVPFEGETALSVVVKHKTEPPPDPRKINPQISEELSRVILRCLEKEIDKRYRKAEDLEADLARLEKSIPAAEKVLPKRKAVTSKELTMAIKKKWKTAAALAAVAIIAVLAALYLRPGKPGPTTAAGKKRLAVLPFENLGPPEDEYFADGITDEIIARLTGVGELGVIARNSSMQYKKTTKSIRQISEELGVDYILSGTIRWQKSGDGAGRVRVIPTLIRAPEATQLWANVYDESLAEIFQVQSDISRKLVDALGIALLEPERKALDARPTQNMEAYEYYLRGNDYFWHRGQDAERNARLSIEMFKKATNLDQSFYQAYAYLARAQASYYWYHFDHSSGRVAKAKEAADKASQINSEAPEVHVALGYYYYWCMLDYEQALKHFAMALEKQPNNTETHMGLAAVKRRKGNIEEAVASFKIASELDPRSSIIAYNLGETYALLRDYQAAEKCYDRALFLRPDYDRVYSWKTRLFINQGEAKKARQVLEEASRNLERLDASLLVYQWVLVDILEGRYEEAIKRLSFESSPAYSDQFYFVPKDNLAAQVYGLMNDGQMEKSHYGKAEKFLEEKIKEDPEDSRYWSSLGIAFAGLGRKKEAVQVAEKAVEILPISKDFYRGTFRAKDLAQVYCMVGEYDKALDQIEYLLSIPGELSIPLLRIDPVWAPLRSLPRFQNLVDKFQ